MNTLHKFDEIHIDEDCSSVTGLHNNALFFGCLFKSVAGLTLKDCDLNRSVFDVNSINDALGFTLTLGCKSFRSVKYSPLMVDLLLYLLTLTDGNDSRRDEIRDMLGEDKVRIFDRVLKRVE